MSNIDGGGGGGGAGALVDFEPPCGSSMLAYAVTLDALAKTSASARKRLLIMSLDFFMRILLCRRNAALTVDVCTYLSRYSLIKEAMVYERNSQFFG
jgi:hypothetical protein